MSNITQNIELCGDLIKQTMYAGFAQVIFAKFNEFLHDYTQQMLLRAYMHSLLTESKLFVSDNKRNHLTTNESKPNQAVLIESKEAKPSTSKNNNSTSQSSQHDYIAEATIAKQLHTTFATSFSSDFATKFSKDIESIAKSILKVKKNIKAGLKNDPDGKKTADTLQKEVMGRVVEITTHLPKYESQETYNTSLQEFIAKLFLQMGNMFDDISNAKALEMVTEQIVASMCKNLEVLNVRALITVEKAFIELVVANHKDEIQNTLPELLKRLDFVGAGLVPEVAHDDDVPNTPTPGF